MGCLEGLIPAWYALLSALGLILSAIVIWYAGYSSQEKVYSYTGEFVLAAVIFAVAVVYLVGSTFWCLLTCRLEDDEASQLHQDDCCVGNTKELILDVLALVLGCLVLALAAIIASLGEILVTNSQSTYAAVVVAVSSISIVVSVGKLVKHALEARVPLPLLEQSSTVADLSLSKTDLSV